MPRHFGMMNASKSCFSNCPTEAILKPFPSPVSAMPEGLDDTISGVDGQLGADKAKFRSVTKPRNA
jgi:hypothetical protein